MTTEWRSNLSHTHDELFPFPVPVQSRYFDVPALLGSSSFSLSVCVFNPFLLTCTEVRPQ